ncbi:MAG: hypothetical protein SGJ09_06925 [Phycisphaerae bacterium]|nr:hypothetical protein [Phycisphaerae bacterium]
MVALGSSAIHLSLMVGSVVPVPAPREIVDALIDVTIATASGATSGFQLNFRVSTRSLLHTVFLISGGAMPPLMRVILTAVVNGVPEVLIDGVMTHHETSTGSDGTATLTVTGEDLTRVMDWIDFSGIPYPSMPPEARVALIVAKYAGLGMFPMAIPTLLPEVHVPTDKIPAHQGKDLFYVRALAMRAGYIFHIEPGPVPGVSIAYWGPEIKAGIPQPALTLDIDLSRNVEKMKFTVDTQKRVMPVVYVQEPITRMPIPIPIPDVSLVNPPLGLVVPTPVEFRPIEGMAKRTFASAALLGLGDAAKSSEAVSATGSLDVLRYGHVLKPRRLVGVRGAGLAWDGLWYVKKVTHRLKRGEFKQDFTLTRNGLLSTIPVVPV